YKAGSWDVTPNTDRPITEATTYTYTYAQKAAISATVTFKVANGSWNEGEGEAATADKTVTLTDYEGDTLKLTADQIPAVGNKPNDTYKAGSWDVTPNTDRPITEATTYTYTYAQKAAISATVTFKVENGQWNDQTTVEKTESLSGLEGDVLKLSADQIPTAGSYPDTNYKEGGWDTVPNTETVFEAGSETTYTYTYAAKDMPVIETSPAGAENLTFDESEHDLLSEPGTVQNGTIYYRVNGEGGFSTEPPKGTALGTYTVEWYVKGNDNYGDWGSEDHPYGSIEVKISEPMVPMTQKVIFHHVKKSGAWGVPSDMQDTDVTITIRIKDGDVVSEGTVVMTVGAGQKDSNPIDVVFNRTMVNLSNITVSGPGELISAAPISQKYKLTYQASFKDVINVYVTWDDGKGSEPEVIRVYALPEDEIGAYHILPDGTKEYLLFHTYDICMAWLGRDDLCRGPERCFHKSSPYENPFVTEYGLIEEHVR
ncbi:MAG: hypothetical protein IJI41_10785, partial [Anaerolineaceae bacterium]|nr:hypothetical protein [Anaerolineaceae bacterium]